MTLCNSTRVSQLAKVGNVFLLIGALFYPGSGVGAENSDPRLFECPRGSEPDAAAAAKLMQAPWNTEGLACGASTYVAIANQGPADTQLQFAALRANERYMYYLDRIILYELGYLINWYVDDVPEEKKLNAPMRALIAAQEEQGKLIQHLRSQSIESPELDYFEAQTRGVSAQALPLLQAAVIGDPPLLAGAAHAMLAETYYALPDVLGGDLGRAITMMQAARERAPDNPRFSRILAGYLLDEGKPDKAASLLRALMALKPAEPELQLYADQLRSAAEMAKRLNDMPLSEELATQREQMLKQHPYLQTRKVVSAMGHFGSNDPLEEK